MNQLTIQDILEEDTLYSFYGVNGTEFKLGNIVFEAIEDEDDGYRSYLDSVPMVKSDSVFFKRPLINVYYDSYVQQYSKNEYQDYEGGFVLKDETGHVWLTVCTDHGDSYYPYFVFEYTPREDLKDFDDIIENLPEYDPKELHVEKLI